MWRREAEDLQIDEPNRLAMASSIRFATSYCSSRSGSMFTLFGLNSRAVT